MKYSEAVVIELIMHNLKDILLKSKNSICDVLYSYDPQYIRSNMNFLRKYFKLLDLYLTIAAAIKNNQNVLGLDVDGKVIGAILEYDTQGDYITKFYSKLDF